MKIITARKFTGDPDAVVLAEAIEAARAVLSEMLTLQRLSRSRIRRVDIILAEAIVTVTEDGKETDDGE